MEECIDMDINDIDLLKLQTLFMQQDPTTQAMCATLNPQFKSIFAEIKKCLILPNIDQLPVELLDELAYELHIDWYEPTASIDIKRALIKNSDKVHMYLGTPYAIEQVVLDYFGDGTIEEWYQYGGEPYHFRFVTSDPSITGELAELFASSVEKVKRKSTVMDAVVLDLAAQHSTYYACVLCTVDFCILG
jgi:phage tail P2-like protein